MSEAKTSLQAELSWFKSAVDKWAAAYIENFDISDKLTARRRYKLLIESGSKETTKKAVADDFEYWKNSKGHKFRLDYGLIRIERFVGLIPSSGSWEYESIH
ncbi:hypothetical protein BGX24_003221 [Mortierella sp. AD032]|nr:hypothetical protein BGX24_003221 [Mortierella sp. AD032]